MLSLLLGSYFQLELLDSSKEGKEKHILHQSYLQTLFFYKCFLIFSHFSTTFLSLSPSLSPLVSFLFFSFSFFFYFSTFLLLPLTFSLHFSPEVFFNKKFPLYITRRLLVCFCSGDSRETFPPLLYLFVPSLLFPRYRIQDFHSSESILLPGWMGMFG